MRLAKAANVDEIAKSSVRGEGKNHPSQEVEIRLIIIDVKRLLVRIEDAVPLINLAITTSGARLTTSLPSTVSPSRLLQASTFLTAGDTRYSMAPNAPVQVGPTFVLSLYMLFGGNVRAQDDLNNVREMTWKEAIHKARVKIMRTPLAFAHEGRDGDKIGSSIHDTRKKSDSSVINDQSQANEFAYHIDIVEDLDDDRVHSYDENEPQPGQYDDVALAGIREIVPIHQISKIFYADTGKILDLGSSEETNNPVLLFKRDINALPPRKMMLSHEQDDDFQNFDAQSSDNSGEDDLEDIHSVLEQQIHRESSVPCPEDLPVTNNGSDHDVWRLPSNLDAEWLAFEVYTESSASSVSSDDGYDENNDSAYVSHRPSSSDQPTQLATDFSNLHLSSAASPHNLSSPPRPSHSSSVMTALPSSHAPHIRTSLSLLEMLVRLTALQQFQQASHLAIPDELLTFFLEESSTTGAGGDGEQRRYTRQEARRKVGFDPYDESPIKRRGEEYLEQHDGGWNEESADTGYPVSPRFNRAGTPASPRWASEEPSSGFSERVSSSSHHSKRHGRDVETMPSSPLSNYRPKVSKLVGANSRNALLVKAQKQSTNFGSPLSRTHVPQEDSTLGSSPGSPSPLRKET